jgi:1,4-dihydroxy-2-naphthoate octaprenyltransferase
VGVIFLISGLVLGFAVIIGETQARMHYAMVVAVSVLVAVILFLITELAHRFLGEIGTSPEPMRAVIQLVESR